MTTRKDMLEAALDRLVERADRQDGQWTPEMIAARVELQIRAQEA